jgi:hypothetical protein
MLLRGAAGGLSADPTLLLLKPGVPSRSAGGGRKGVRCGGAGPPPRGVEVGGASVLGEKGVIVGTSHARTRTRSQVAGGRVRSDSVGQYVDLNRYDGVLALWTFQRL